MMPPRTPSRPLVSDWHTASEADRRRVRSLLAVLAVFAIVVVLLLLSIWAAR